MFDYPKSYTRKKNETILTMRQVLNDLEAGNPPNLIKEQQDMIETWRNSRNRKNEGQKQAQALR